MFNVNAIIAKFYVNRNAPDIGRNGDAVIAVNANVCSFDTDRHIRYVGQIERFDRAVRIGLGLRFQLDVFEYVPWLEATPMAYVTTGDVPTDGALGLAIRSAFDRLLTPTWSVGVGGAYHQVAGEERVPAYLDVGLRVGYRIVLGDPFAP